ncbi:MAG: hypothetical protein WCE46_02570 [Methanoregula sp.]|uniref:hypothetical protein n=1 Tax=Methanoregula sp. TaxID=2052170 RepID=UPI003C74EF80
MADISHLPQCLIWPVRMADLFDIPPDDFPRAIFESRSEQHRRFVDSHLRKFMQGKKSPKTLENAKKIISYFERKSYYSGGFCNSVLNTEVVRRSEIVHDLVEGRGGGKTSICPDCVWPNDQNCPFNHLFKNENTLNRLLKQLSESNILRRIERKKKYPRSSPLKEKPDVFYRIDSRIYTKMVTEADEIEFLHGQSHYYMQEWTKTEILLNNAYDLLKEHGVEDAKVMVENRAQARGDQILLTTP